MATSSSPITQVSQHAPAPISSLQPQLLTRLTLDLRGQKFSVDRETIMNLPESVLLCLFPNGLVLSRQSTAGDGGESDEDEDVYAVDVSRARLVLLKGRRGGGRVKLKCELTSNVVHRSLTPSASPLFSHSSVKRKIRSTEPQTFQGCIKHSNISSIRGRKTFPPSSLRPRILS